MTSLPHTAAGPTHSTPHPLITYQHYLKDLYSPEYPGYSKPQFNRHRPKQIVNLALVHREDDEGDKLQRECLLYQLHGNIDMIQQKKTPLTKDQITVLASGATARTVLIEGAPGIGKTTLLWQLCHQWANGKLLQQWELVILVQLRDETTRTAQCLSDLLYHPRQNIREAICREIEEREGENVLLIFDGYDELSYDQRTDSIFIRLLRQESRELRKATVVVSSRPFATKTLPHQFKNSLDQHVEIVGFNEQDIETYLTSACQDTLTCRDLKSYISTQAFISSVLYNPLHCTCGREERHWAAHCCSSLPFAHWWQSCHSKVVLPMPGAPSISTVRAVAPLASTVIWSLVTGRGGTLAVTVSFIILSMDQGQIDNLLGTSD